MPLTLITGPINSGKTARALDCLAETDPGRTGTVVVPCRETASSLRERFAGGREGDFHALRGDSIQDWASFMRSLANPNLPVATRPHSTLIILGLLDRTKLVYFKGPRSYATAEGFARTILALKENLVTPDDLAEVIDGLGEARPRERDLIKIYELYERELTRLEMLDEADLTLLAIANAPDALSAMETILFDEFTMPTPAQLAIVRALTKGLPDTAIVVTCPLAHGADEKPFAEWLARARDTWLTVCTDEEELPAPKAKRPKVRVVTAPSPAQEARHVALMVDNDTTVATKTDDSFLEWYLSEAHSMELLPEHPTLDGARASPLAHEMISPDMVEKLPAQANIKEFAGEMLALSKVKAKARGWIAGLKKRRGHGRVAARSLTAISIVEEALRGLSSSSPMLGRTAITREQFAQILSDELARRTAPTTMLESALPFKRLTLGTPLAVRTRKLVVPRMIEGAYPTRAGETLFFGDWKEETIRRIFPDAEDNHARESYAFETMVKKCAGKITLIAPAVNDAASATTISPFSATFLSEGEIPHELLPIVIDRSASGRPFGELDRVFSVERARIAGADPDESTLGNYLGRIESRESMDLIRKRFTGSEIGTTSLEKYGNCRFQFFAQEVLKVKESLDDTPEIRSLDRGILVHEILARYYRDCKQRQQGTQRKQRSEEIIEKIAEEVWGEMEGKLGYVSPGLREREISEIAQMALAVVRTEAEERDHLSDPLAPRAFEWSFGTDEDNALEIEVPGDKPLLVRGRVDRVDLDAEGTRFLVIDYKSGAAEAVKSKIGKGKHLQLPLYIDAVGKNLYPKARALGGLLLAIKEIEAAGDGKKTPGKTKGIVLKEFKNCCYRLGSARSGVDDDELGELIETAKVFAGEYAAGIRGGSFAPSDDAVCRNCKYVDICRQEGVSAD